MNKGSLLRRFIRVTRSFGIGVALRVTYSKVRGVLFPALALPDALDYDNPRRQLSILIATADHEAETIEAIAATLAERGGSDWEMCVCARSPMGTQMERALVRLREAKAHIHIVSADRLVDETMAARWTVEQCTGEFVALVAPHSVFDADAASRLIARLGDNPELKAAALDGTNGDAPAGDRLSRQTGECRLILQRKSEYLGIGSSARWPLAARDLAQALTKAGARVETIAVGRVEAVD